METQALHFAELKLVISPNVGDSGAQFLVGGDCVRASPVSYNSNRTCTVPCQLTKATQLSPAHEGSSCLNVGYIPVYSSGELTPANLVRHPRYNYIFYCQWEKSMK